MLGTSTSVETLDTMATKKKQQPETRQVVPEKHEALLFRKVVILAAERMGRETGHYKRNSNRYENMKALIDQTGITRTVIPNIMKGSTKEPTRQTFQKIATWLASLEEPLTDERGTPIQYKWYELEMLDHAAREQGLDKTDPYIVRYDKELRGEEVEEPSTSKPVSSKKSGSNETTTEEKVDKLYDMVTAIMESLKK